VHVVGEFNNQVTSSGGKNPDINPEWAVSQRGLSCVTARHGTFQEPAVKDVHCIRSYACIRIRGLPGPVAVNGGPEKLSAIKAKREFGDKFQSNDNP
jgi:hypothetical protein